MQTDGHGIRKAVMATLPIPPIKLSEIYSNGFRRLQCDKHKASAVRNYIRFMPETAGDEGQGMKQVSRAKMCQSLKK